MKNNNNALNKLMIVLKREIPKAVFKASAQAMNDNTISFFNNHPRGIGTTGTIMRPIQVSGQRSTDIITMFPSGYPALLELGPDGSKAGYSYPYDSEFGTYIAFADEPNLQLWAEKNLSDLKGMRGLKVGGHNTFYGKIDNKWFTHSSTKLKKDASSKTKILDELRKIKVN